MAPALTSHAIVFVLLRPLRSVPRLRNHATQSGLAVTEFEDDVSGWGRQVTEDQDYEDDEMSHASLSSGLSPRESRPRTRPWDLAEGYKVNIFAAKHCSGSCLVSFPACKYL